jgi:signal transduction histidine kinase
VLAFRFGTEIVAVQYDSRALVPQGILRRALLSDERGNTLIAGPGADGRLLIARGKRWPVIAATFVDTDSALASWRGALPLYFFVILGPALAGACLAPLFVGEFERRARASRAIRTLRSAGAMERRLLVRLAEAERRAVEGVRSKNEFISHMSHELRTPLNAVIGFAEIIHKGLFGPAGHPKYVEYARDIAQAGRNLHGKIGDILEYANAEAGRDPVKRELVDLWEIASEVASEHQGQGFARRISLELGVSDRLIAVADRSAARRIVSILLTNALLYARDGARVRLDVRAESGTACLVVRDSGVGFSSDERRRAGQAFVRFDRDGGKTGAGLGLAIATVLAHRMGGALVIGGYHGLGAVVELRLPLGRTTSSAELASRNSTRGHGDHGE